MQTKLKYMVKAMEYAQTYVIGDERDYAGQIRMLIRILRLPNGMQIRLVNGKCGASYGDTSTITAVHGGINKAEVMSYEKAEDKTTRLWGIKKCEDEAWWIEPKYEAIEERRPYDDKQLFWFMQNGKYGLLNIETREEVIPAKYGYPLFFQHGYAEAWLDYKTGVINMAGEVVIPIIYDELYCRSQDSMFWGFDCYTNEGLRQAYDENMQPCEPQEWDRDWKADCTFV